MLKMLLTRYCEEFSNVDLMRSGCLTVSLILALVGVGASNVSLTASWFFSVRGVGNHSKTAAPGKRTRRNGGNDRESIYPRVYASKPQLTISNIFDPLSSKTMTKKQWLALLVLYVTYLFLGALVFFYLEKDQETIQRNNDYKLYEKLVAVMKECGLNRSLMSDLENYCGRPLTEKADLDDITPRLWDFYNSVFFVITVASTVGYGNIHPTTPLTRTIMIFYAIIGIPMNGILLTSLAQFFSNVFIQAHKKYKRYESRCGLAVDILKYLVPGMLFFIFVPATAFYYFEEWTYEESVYYAFVTLTTIGFGDMVAGQKQFKEFDSDVILLYKILLLCWIIIGLGYLIMLLGFITRAMRSKKMVQIEHKLVEALTHSKIWHGFSKDIGYLRRLMNELYLDKFKPVFLDEHQQQKHIFHRSKSLPNIAFGMDEEDFFDPVDLYRKRRANSEFMFGKTRMWRVCSESDIHRIDRRATFASASKIQPDELIRHVVTAMGGSFREQDEPRGIDVFSDDEILKSEAYHERKGTSVVSLNYPPPYEEAIKSRRKRMRALSECPPEINGQTLTSRDHLEWTWSGAGSNKIFDIVNECHKRSLQMSKEDSRMKSTGSLASGAKLLNPRWKRLKSNSEIMSGSRMSGNGDLKITDGIGKFDVTQPGDLLNVTGSNFKTEGHYVTYTAGAGAQGIGLIHGNNMLSKPESSLYELYKSGDHLFSTGRKEPFEGHSLAEFLRVLSTLHSRIGSQRDEFQSTSGDPPSPRIESLVGLFSPIEPKPPEKLQEPSNLKRLGRFLLRSYSQVPKTESPESSQSKTRKPFQIKNSGLADSYHTISGNPSVRIEIESPEGETYNLNGSYSSFNMEEPQANNNGRMKGRRCSSPTLTTEPTRFDRFRMGTSSESVFSDPRRFPPRSRHYSMIRRRPGESYSAKPGLSDVKEIIK